MILTFPFGSSQELCLYTLGNLCPADVIKDKLVAQGIIPALANCIEVKPQGLNTFAIVKLDYVIILKHRSVPHSVKVSLNVFLLFSEPQT